MEQKLLYKLRSTQYPDDCVYPIEIWNENYVVAVSLWTTNGSVAYVARQTADYVKAGIYEVVDAQIEADFTDQESIKRAVMTQIPKAVWV